MRVYLLKESDFEALFAAIDRNPEHGQDGGSSQVFSAVQKEALRDAHRFYNYQVRRWAAKLRVE